MLSVEAHVKAALATRGAVAGKERVPVTTGPRCEGEGIGRQGTDTLHPECCGPGMTTPAKQVQPVVQVSLWGDGTAWLVLTSVGVEIHVSHRLEQPNATLVHRFYKVVIVFSHYMISL